MNKQFVAVAKKRNPSMEERDRDSREDGKKRQRKIGSNIQSQAIK